MIHLTDYFGKTITVRIGNFTRETIYNVIGFDNNNDVILVTVKQTNTTQLPNNDWFGGKVIIEEKTTGFVNPFTVDKLWFDMELTGRKIQIIN